MIKMQHPKMMKPRCNIPDPFFTQSEPVASTVGGGWLPCAPEEAGSPQGMRSPQLCECACVCVCVCDSFVCICYIPFNEFERSRE